MMSTFDNFVGKLLGVLRFAGIASVALMASCATLKMPDPDVMRLKAADFHLPQLPEPDKAMVYVIRPSALDGIVRFNLFVDDKLPASEVGYTRGGQYIFFSVTPGKHTIFSNAGNWAEIDIMAKAREVIFLRQEPASEWSISGSSLFLVEAYEGKFGVKNLQPGTLVTPGKE